MQAGSNIHNQMAKVYIWKKGKSLFTFKIIKIKFVLPDLLLPRIVVLQAGQTRKYLYPPSKKNPCVIVSMTRVTQNLSCKNTKPFYSLWLPASWHRKDCKKYTQRKQGMKTLFIFCIRNHCNSNIFYSLLWKFGSTNIL